MRTLLQDFRHAARQMRRTPAFAVVAILTLALGIGANVAIFSMVDWLLIRPLPVKDAGQITVLRLQQNLKILLATISIPDYQDIRSQTTAVFDGLCGYELSLDGLSVDGGKADRLVTNYVTGNFFSVLGIKPALGRFIVPSEGQTPGADPVIVLSYSYWKQHLGGERGIIGKKVSFDGHPVTIVGVAPEGFHGVEPIVSIAAYLPLGMAAATQRPGFMENRGDRSLSVVGRLRKGVSLQQAQASLTVVSQRLSQQYPEIEKNVTMLVFPETSVRLGGDPRTSNTTLLSGLFLGLAVLVLLLACVNVGNVLLVRAAIRERELAIRAALGAGRAHLIRLLLTEGILLAVVGGAAGMVLGTWGGAALRSLNLHTDFPVQLDFRFDWRVFIYAFGMALAAGVVVGIFPALRAARRDLNQVLHQGGRGLVGGGQKLRSALVVVQVGGSLMLLIIAALFTRSLAQAQRTDLGFDPAHVVNLTMDPQEIGYHGEQTREFYHNLLQRVRALPGVSVASTAFSVPLGYYSNGGTLDIDGYQPPSGQPAPVAVMNYVSPGNFQTLGIPLLRGRDVNDRDEDKAPYVAVVNQTFVKQYWPNLNPIGRHFRSVDDPSHNIEVVGVAKDARYIFVQGPEYPLVYFPFAQHVRDASLETLQVRTTGDPKTMIPELERTIQSVAPDLPVFEVKTMTEALYTLNGFLAYEVAAGLAAAMGILGLGLSIVGVYGVISYAASQRTHEIGVRMALGAQPQEILRMILRQGIVIVAVGLVVGVLAALAAAKVVGTFLTVSPTDPVAYVAVSVLLALVALAACTIPARRAMRVDPMVALHYE
ncbi:MAG TPA: ABC transporter permease [Terriglobales bacterium]|nr:ABC transporter permease [Terriglobales bacterium]